MATAALIEELAATWEVWADAGRRLPEAAWQAPTRLPGWNVRDLRYAGLLTVTVCCALQVGVVESTVHLLDLRPP